MKKRIVLSVILAILLAGGIFLDRLLPVVTGYAAKNLASGVFVAGRSQASLEKEDLNFSIIKYARNRVDLKKKAVTSRFLWKTSKAVYNEGFGCALVDGYSEDEIKERPYRRVEPFPANPDTIPWPMGDRLKDTVPPGINMPVLQHAVNRIMADTVPFKGTFALLVVYKGQPVSEVYRKDFVPGTRFLSWSMAKSFTGTLIGLRAGEGKLVINQPLNLAEWKNDDRRNITLNNLMHMNSGLAWNEDYGALSDVTIMLFKEGDMGAYTAGKPLDYRPDSVWSYSSGTSNLVSLVLRRSFASDADYYAYPREALFNKIGMRSAVFEVDASGTFTGSSYLYATMRDYARYALLYMNGGKWMGRQVLPEGWVKYTTTPAKGSDGKYGAFFWLNLSGDQPDAPKDTYMCKGHDGQFIFIIPSKQLIVVRTGFSKHGEFDTNLMLKEILKSLN